MYAWINQAHTNSQLSSHVKHQCSVSEGPQSKLDSKHKPCVCNELSNPCFKGCAVPWNQHRELNWVLQRKCYYCATDCHSLAAFEVRGAVVAMDTVPCLQLLTAIMEGYATCASHSESLDFRLVEAAGGQTAIAFRLLTRLT